MSVDVARYIQGGMLVDSPKSVAKSLVKRLIRYSVSKLPYGAQQQALLQLSQGEQAFDALYSLAASMNVVALSVRGDYGVISQSLADRAMLPVYASSGKWASDTNEIILDFFAGTNGCGTYIDVGANIGLTTIPVAQNPGVHCIALEPEPSNFRYLSENVRANCPHGNVVLLEKAAFSSRATLQFELSPTNLGDHRIRRTETEGLLNEHLRRIIEVEADRLDDLVPKLTLPLAVKIDAEGAEPFIFAGGTKTLSQAGLLIVEIWPYGIDRMGGTVEPIGSLLENNFGSVCFSRTDVGKSPDILPAGAVSAKLDEAMLRKSDPGFHFDVIATKS